jgi:tetraacyldisaccharide 4'-kinase
MHLVEKLWYCRRYRPLMGLLRPLSFLFEKLARRRKLRLQTRAIKSSVPVVVVGNLTVGGTGKTPIVIALVRFLMAQGIKVGVISRGYKRQRICQKKIVIVSDASSVAEVGDEPYLIYKETLCPLVVGVDRCKALEVLLENFKVDVVLSDDGLQHYALARDLEIIVCDGRRLWGHGWCLPAGPLREPISRIESVDFVLVNQAQDELLGHVEQQQKFFNFQIKPEQLVKVDPSHALISMAYLQNLSCYAVAGIAYPERFFAALKALGAQIKTCVFADHHHFVPADFKKLDDLPIVMTQKDAVKCEHLGLSQAYALEIGAVLPQAFLDVFLTRLKNIRNTVVS